MTRPIAVSCGEPAGIGPDLIEAAWRALRAEMVFYWIGDPAHLPGGVPAARISAPDEAASAMAEALPVLPLGFDGPRVPGRAQPGHAASVIAAIEQGVRACMAGAARGICTLPIHKQALQEGAGFGFPGHTEFLAHLTGADEVVMMLVSDRLRVVPVTIHIPLAEVPRALTPALLDRRLRLTHDGLKAQFGLAEPRLAVAGLNPHAGEGGVMGREEIEIIAPVLDRLRLEGLRITGPLSADTLFHAEARAGYDVAVCMYHDQALIPIKTLDFDRGVNVTLGLPILRASPDHGTAFDIAGRGTANATSTIEALRLLWRLGG